MEEFDELLEKDNKIHEIFEANASLLFEMMRMSYIPQTVHAFLNFITKTNFIKEGIFDLYESENLYAINILFRSLIEHNLRFTYIFFRAVIDKTDEIGEEYLKFCSLSENIDTGKAWKDVAKILDKDPKLDPYEVLKEVSNDYNFYSKQEISQKAEQFRYKNIIRYINKYLNKEQSFKGNPYLLRLIPQYADLSSFVHGGPGADKILMGFNDKEKLEKELIRIMNHSFHIAASVKMLTFLICSKHDPRLGKAYTDINEVLTQKNSQSEKQS